MRLALATGLVLAAAALAAAEERSPFDLKNRFLDGSVKPDGAKIRPSTFLVESFEDDALVHRDWTCTAKVESSEEHATDGKKSLKATFPNKTSSLKYRRGGSGWGSKDAEIATAWSLQLLFNDEAVLDVFNAEDRTVKLVVSMGKAFSFDLKPGANTLRIKTRDMVDGAYRTTAILPATEIKVEDDKPVTLFLDNFRWVGPGLGENLIKFGKCFHCGPSLVGQVALEMLRPYFLPLMSDSAYAKEQGYGWEKPTPPGGGYYGCAQTVVMGSSGRQPHDPIFRSGIVGISSPLIVDLPDGKYRVQWTEGGISPHASANFPCDYDLSVKVGDKVTPIRKRARDFSERARWFYGRDRKDYMPGEDRWLKYMNDFFYPLECDVEVTGGQLKLEFLTSPANRADANFIMIYPLDKANVIEPEIAAFWNDVRDRFNTLCYQQATIDMATKMNLPGLHEEFVKPDEAAKARQAMAASLAAKDGLVVFRRDAMDDVYPDTVPAAGDIADSVSTFVPPGEIAALPINLHATRDISNLKVVIGELTGLGGARIPPAACDLRFVRYEYRMSGQQGHGDWKWMIMPWYLVKRDSIDMAKGMSVRWWLSVDVPADTKPGPYVAKVKIAAKDLPAREVTLTLDVLPIKLDPVPEGVEFSTRYALRQQFCTLPDVGFSVLSTRLDKAAAADWAKQMKDALLNKVAAEYSLMKRYGINHVYRRTDNSAREMTLGATYVEIPEETLKIVPTVELASADKPADKVFLKREGGLGGALKSTCEAKVKEIAASNKKAIIFGVPLHGTDGFAAWSDVQEESGIYRFCSGFFLWRIGASGCVAEPWQMSLSDLYVPFCGHSGQWGSFCTPASTGWPTLNRALILEGLREGILDYRHIVTLERLIKENEGKPAAVEAKQYLDKLRSSIEGTAEHYFTNVDRRGGWDNTWHQKDTAWKGKEYADARRQIGGFIGKLQAK